MNELLPLGIAVFLEPTADQLIQKFAGTINVSGLGQIDDLIKVGLGDYAYRKRGTFWKAVKYFGIFGARNLISQYVGQGLGLNILKVPTQTQNNTSEVW